MKKIRVLIAEDQQMMRQGLAAMLSYPSDSNIEVVGQAEDGIQAVQMVKETQPDVLILDLQMPRQGGLETIPQVKEIAPQVCILVLTGFTEGEKVYEAIKAGALGYMLKDSTKEQLLKAIREVANGEAFLEPSIALKMISEINNPKEGPYTAEPLTPRELETLQLIARGLSNQEIAAELVVHERTIAKYVSNILNKLHLANRTQAALYALREGLSKLSDAKEE